MRAVRLLLILVLLVISAPGRSGAQSDYAARAPEGKLQFTFVGNASFAISDGDMTLMTDYPYRPGAYGYNSYDLDATRPRGYAICLITHAHDDHFHFRSYMDRSWALVGPAEVVAVVPDHDVTAAVDGVPIEIEGIHILPIATPHQGVEHYSYLVTWHGVRMFFSGDTEVDRYLLQTQDLDVAFVPPWLLAGIAGEGAKIDARMVVVYHHKDNEDVVDYADRVLPSQGDVFEIDFREITAPSQ